MNKVESMRHISFAAVLLLAAYGDGGTTPTPPATPVAASVTLTGDEPELRLVGSNTATHGYDPGPERLDDERCQRDVVYVRCVCRDGLFYFRHFTFHRLGHLGSERNGDDHRFFGIG